MDYHKTNKNERASFLQIPVSQFRDQQKFQDWFELRSEQNKPMGKIYLTIQWIHSRVKYLEEVIQHWDQSTKQQQIEYQDFQSDLWTIYEPWKLLYEGQRKQQSVLDFTAKKGVQNSLLLPDSQQNKGILHKLELAQLDYVQQSQLVNLAYVILALFASYYRATFLDMMVGLLFWQWLSMNELIPERIRFLLGLIALSLILDLGWLITYTGGWTSDQNNKGLDTVLEEPAKSFSLIFSYLLFFFKPILGYTYFKAMQILQSSESENQQEIKI